jgi:hypothetical protein
LNVLLDHNVPVQLISFLSNHTVRTAAQEGWDALLNGDLLMAANAYFDVFVTCDQNIVHQQRLTGRALAIVAVSTNIWPVIKADPARITQAIDAARAGTYQAVNYPRPPLRRRLYPSTS